MTIRDQPERGRYLSASQDCGFDGKEYRQRRIAAEIASAAYHRAIITLLRRGGA